jgi:hypothetical protein
MLFDFDGPPMATGAGTASRYRRPCPSADPGPTQRHRTADRCRLLALASEQGLGLVALSFAVRSGCGPTL